MAADELRTMLEDLGDLVLILKERTEVMNKACAAAIKVRDPKTFKVPKDLNRKVLLAINARNRTDGLVKAQALVLFAEAVELAEARKSRRKRRKSHTSGR